MSTNIVMIWLLSLNGPILLDGQAVQSAPFSGKPVMAGQAHEGRVAVIVKGQQIWVGERGTWALWAESDLNLNCLAWTPDGRLLVGTARARLAWVERHGLSFIGSFDAVEGRKDWNTPWGGPPDVRSLAVATDGTLYANIHVGWIVRSRDGGKTWKNLRRGLDKDVHMVAAHPREPNIVFCATARGFHYSDDHGDTFTRQSEPMPYHYQRACACFPDEDVYLASTSRGPHGTANARLFRSTDQGRSWEEAQGLPDNICKNIDTYQILTMRNGNGLVIVDNKHVYETQDYGATWSVIEKEFPRLYSVLVH